VKKASLPLSSPAALPPLLTGPGSRRVPLSRWAEWLDQMKAAGWQKGEWQIEADGWPVLVLTRSAKSEPLAEPD
jgi:hypothetical protein